MPNSSRRSGLIAALVLSVLTIGAFRDLLARGLGVSTDAAVFAVAPLPGFLVLLVACWYGWHRLRLDVGRAPSDDRPSTTGVLVGLFLACALILAWARAVGEAGLQFVALMLFVSGVAFCLGGAALAGRFRAPLGVLLLGLSIPRPLEDEIVWTLQRSTAAGAHAVLNAIGHEVKVAGVILRDGTHTFHVIDSCSGLTGILILLVIAVIVRELFELSKLRSTILLAVTIAIGWVVNVLRVAYVASRPNPETLAGAGGDHTLQGVIVLAVGSAAVYASGLLLEDREGMTSSDGPRATAAALPVFGAGRVVPCLVAAGALFVTSLVVPRGVLVANEAPLSRSFGLEEPGGRWRSEEAPQEPYFNGVFVDQYHRRFVHKGNSRPLSFVDVFVGQGRAQGELSTRAFSSKRFYPGPDWNLLSHERRMSWALGREIDTSVSAPNVQREHAVLYVWMLGHDGLILESLRSLIGLDRLRPEEALAEPVLVKVMAFSPSGKELPLSDARTRLEAFIRDHEEQFAALRGEAR